MPKPAKKSARERLMVEAFKCHECGLTKADEDGCCATCGRDCKVVPAILGPRAAKRGGR